MKSATRYDLEKARNRFRKNDGTSHSGWLWKHDVGPNRKMKRSGIVEILDK